MLNAGNRKLDIFTGIDIFGRGTFGGGKFNSSDAIHVYYQIWLLDIILPNLIKEIIK